MSLVLGMKAGLTRSTKEFLLEFGSVYHDEQHPCSIDKKGDFGVNSVNENGDSEYREQGGTADLQGPWDDKKHAGQRFGAS
jgi:hypothetical protein